MNNNQQFPKPKSQKCRYCCQKFLTTNAEAYTNAICQLCRNRDGPLNQGCRGCPNCLGW